MQKLRPFLTALLGLTLWVQGFAIAAAPVAVAADAADTAIEMPCHGDAAASVAACDCCDGDCDDMAGCVVGSFAGAPAVLLQADLTPQAAIAARAWSVKTAVSPLPLRPPIVSHA
jgi:hypothetical protein